MTSVWSSTNQELYLRKNSGFSNFGEKKNDKENLNYDDENNNLKIEQRKVGSLVWIK